MTVGGRVCHKTTKRQPNHSGSGQGSLVVLRRIAILVLLISMGKARERTRKKLSTRYLELAAMGGMVRARHERGIIEVQAGNIKEQEALYDCRGGRI